MEISDEDILEMNDITVDMELANAVYVMMFCDDRLIKKIQVKSHTDGYKLVCQLLEYQEGLRDGKVN